MTPFRAKTLYRAARSVLRAEDLDEALDIVLRATAMLVPTWRSSIGLINEARGVLVLYRVRGGPDLLTAGSEVPLDSFGGDLRLLQAGRYDLVQDVRRKPEASGMLAMTELRSRLMVPLMDQHALVGVMSLSSDRPYAFTDRHVADALELGELLVDALVKIRMRADLQRAEQEALAASRTKSAFLANTSHELRTPLNAIIGYTEMVSEELEDRGLETERVDLLKARSAADHLLGLIDDVLDLSRLEAGQDVPIEIVDVEVAPLVETIRNAVLPLAQRHRNKLRIQVSSEAVVAADPLRLRQVLLNLLGNAAKFTHDGTISLAVRTDGRCVRFVVSDTGIGIAPEKLSTLFEPFTQAHARDEHDFGGSGLGLTIARAYARRIGGQLTVESTPGVGTTFTLTMPAAAQTEVDEALQRTG